MLDQCPLKVVKCLIQTFLQEFLSCGAVSFFLFLLQFHYNSHLVLPMIWHFAVSSRSFVVLSYSTFPMTDGYPTTLSFAYITLLVSPGTTKENKCAVCHNVVAFIFPIDAMNKIHRPENSAYIWLWTLIPWLNCRMELLPPPCLQLHSNQRP